MVDETVALGDCAAACVVEACVVVAVDDVRGSFGARVVELVIGRLSEVAELCMAGELFCEEEDA